MTDRYILFSVPPVATPDMVQAALDLVWEDSKSNDELVRNIWHEMATKFLSTQQHVDCACTKIQQDEHCLVGYPSLLCEICDGKGVVPSPHAQALEEAAKFIDKQVSEYVQEHGVTDPETGTVEFPGWGDEYVSELEELAEGIRALSSQPVADGWLPIETAPKDGTDVIVWSTLYRGKPVIVRWEEDKYAKRPIPRWTTSDSAYGARSFVDCPPTHWRPLPASPGGTE